MCADAGSAGLTDLDADDWREIVHHGERHFVTVVPEIDMPGHTNAALASVPELNVDGVCPPLYTGKQVGFSSLRMHLPATERFVHDVVRTHPLMVADMISDRAQAWGLRPERE